MTRSGLVPYAFILFGIALIGAAPSGVLGQDATRGTPEAEAGVSVVATGLVNPRGFAFGPDDTLHVALAGEPGPTAGVVAIVDGCPAQIVGGVSTLRVVFRALSGVADVAFLDGQLYALVSGGNIDAGGMSNGLYRVEDDGSVTLVADISAFIRDNPVAALPDDYDTDGQPYRMLAVEDGFLVSEGNSNQLLRVTLDGSVTRVVDFSREQPIPTGLAPAPSGAVYVGSFTAAPFPEGTAAVFRVTPGGEVVTVWSGLTMITDLAVDADGTLYALEMATGHGGDPSAIVPGTGRVVRQTGPDTAEAVVTGLALPAAMNFGPDGALYVSGPTFGADNGEGFVLRVDLAGEQPIMVPDELPTAPDCP